MEQEHIAILIYGIVFIFILLIIVLFVQYFSNKETQTIEKCPEDWQCCTDLKNYTEKPCKPIEICDNEQHKCIEKIDNILNIINKILDKISSLFVS